jgi:hypothetical protein
LFVWLKGLGIFNVISFNGHLFHLGPMPLHNFVDHTWDLPNPRQSSSKPSPGHRGQTMHRKRRSATRTQADQDPRRARGRPERLLRSTPTFKTTNLISVGMMNLMNLTIHPKPQNRLSVPIAQKKSITNVATNERNNRQERPFADRRHSGPTSGSQWRQKTASCLLQTPPRGDPSVTNTTVFSHVRGGPGTFGLVNRFFSLNLEYWTCPRRLLPHPRGSTLEHSQSAVPTTRKRHRSPTTANIPREI